MRVSDFSVALWRVIASRKPALRPSIKEILNMEYVRPHLERYFEKVGQLMGIPKEKIRLVSARKPQRHPPNSNLNNNFSSSRTGARKKGKQVAPKANASLQEEPNSDKV